MIRINLLPVKKARRKEAGQRQLFFMAAGVAVAIFVVVAINKFKQDELDGLLRDNKVLQDDIDQLKKELGDYDKIKAQREDLLKQKKTILALQAGRTGPLFLMREMSEILTKNKGPTFDRVDYEDRLRRDPNIQFNAEWDTRLLWLDSFDENQRSFKINGSAKSNEDVAEFMKRLQLSVFFTEVALENTSQVNTPGGRGIKHYTFHLDGTVTY